MKNLMKQLFTIKLRINGFVGTRLHVTRIVQDRRGEFSPVEITETFNLKHYEDKQ
jgi:hypothetical protein